MSGNSSRSSKYRYDVCLSYAVEDRQYVDEVAEHLKNNGTRVFYDKYAQADLWGKNLYTHLDDVYRNLSQFCVMFISATYAHKLWTNHERESAQARAFTENAEYILPARFDDTVIPGLSPTVAYIDLRVKPPVELAELLLKKLHSDTSVGATPSDFFTDKQKQHNRQYRLSAPKHLNAILAFEPLGPIKQRFSKWGLKKTNHIALLCWFFFTILYAGGVSLFHFLMNTNSPENLDILFIAHGNHFYYPDWNAITFDLIIGPTIGTLAIITPIIVYNETTKFHSLPDFSIRKTHLLYASRTVTFVSLTIALFAIADLFIAQYSKFDDPFVFTAYMLFLTGLGVYLRWALFLFILFLTFWLFFLKLNNADRLPENNLTTCVSGLANIASISLISLLVLACNGAAQGIASFFKDYAGILLWESIIQSCLSTLFAILFFFGIVYLPSLQKSEAAGFLIDKYAREEVISRNANLPVWNTIKRHKIVILPLSLWISTPFFLVLIRNLI